MVERALRLAAIAHHDQTRKGTEVPYITHPFAVTLILQRHGFTAPDLLAAALLHDVLEDTPVTVRELADQFPDVVIQLVAALSEVKYDASGNKRPWRVRKEEHLDRLRTGSWEARALTLADKLHNLGGMLFDLDNGMDDIWSRFNASREEVLWYHHGVLDLCRNDSDPRLQALVQECRDCLERLADC